MVAERVLGNAEQPRARAAESGVKSGKTPESAKEDLGRQVLSQVGRGQMKPEIAVQSPAISFVPAATDHLRSFL
jgi:hypothetical protein